MDLAHRTSHKIIWCHIEFGIAPKVALFATALQTGESVAPNVKTTRKTEAPEVEGNLAGKCRRDWRIIKGSRLERPLERWWQNEVMGHCEVMGRYEVLGDMIRESI